MRRVSLPGPSMAVALVALAVSLGGTSYAAVKITSKDVKNNTLTSLDVRTNSLTGQDVRNNSLTSADIRDRSLRAKDFKLGQLPKGDTGPAGIGRWALVNAAGAIEAQSGGFSIAACYPATPAPANGNCYINTNEPLTNNGIVATIALQNQVNQGGGTMNGTNSGGDGTAPAAGDNLEFGGEISATLCGVAGVVGCAPMGTNTVSHVVVSPRLSTGERTTDATRKRFYVILTGDSADYVAPAA